MTSDDQEQVREERVDHRISCTGDSGCDATWHHHSCPKAYAEAYTDPYTPHPTPWTLVTEPYKGWRRKVRDRYVVFLGEIRDANGNKVFSGPSSFNALTEVGACMIVDAVNRVHGEADTPDRSDREGEPTAMQVLEAIHAESRSWPYREAAEVLSRIDRIAEAALDRLSASTDTPDPAPSDAPSGSAYLTEGHDGELPPPWGEGEELDAADKQAFARLLDEQTERVEASDPAPEPVEGDTIIERKQGPAKRIFYGGNVNEEENEVCSLVRESDLRALEDEVRCLRDALDRDDDKVLACPDCRARLYRVGTYGDHGRPGTLALCSEGCGWRGTLLTEVDALDRREGEDGELVTVTIFWDCGCETERKVPDSEVPRRNGIRCSLSRRFEECPECSDSHRSEEAGEDG